LCEIFNERVSEDIEKINKAIDRKKLDLEKVFKKACSENGNYIETVAQNLGLNQLLLSFLAKNTLRPFFEAYANELKDHVDQEHWLKNYCPVCGSKPFMAELSEKEGKRFLICPSCGYKWRFARIRCPYCNNNNHKTLRYFYTEKGGRAYRVDVCDKCKRYIKTIDAKELGEEVIPTIEDVGTMYLDLLAEKQGYNREEKNLF
jgi:FdhE protein